MIQEEKIMSKIIGIDLGTTKQLCSSYGRRKTDRYRKRRGRENHTLLSWHSPKTVSVS